MAQYKKVAALVVLVTILSISIAGCIKYNTPQSSNTGGGNAGSSTGVSLTINSQTTRDQLSNGFFTSTPRPGYKYIVFDVTVTNLNRKDLPMGNPWYFKLATSGGAVYSYSSWSHLLGSSVINPVTSTNAGEKVIGQIAFEIPQNVSPTSLTCNDGGLGNNVVANL